MTIDITIIDMVLSQKMFIILVSYNMQMRTDNLGIMTKIGMYIRLKGMRRYMAGKRCNDSNRKSF